MSVIWLDSIDSTNSEALRRLPELSGGTVLAAREQTAGRGQRGNTWFSALGENLTFSIVLKDLPLKAPEAVRLNYMTSVAVASYLESHGVEAAIKWPNDIYVGDRKICGILISNTVSGTLLKDSVAGIGINLNQVEFPDWIPNPTSLKLITQNNYVIEDELPLAVDEILAEYDAIGEQTAPEYLRRLYLKDTPHQFTDATSGNMFNGVITGVLQDGRLEVRTADGYFSYFAFKEIIY